MQAEAEKPQSRQENLKYRLMLLKRFFQTNLIAILLLFSSVNLYPQGLVSSLPVLTPQLLNYGGDYGHYLPI